MPTNNKTMIEKKPNKILSTIVIVLFWLMMGLLFMATYTVGNLNGNLNMLHSLEDTAGICEMGNNSMEGDYCVLRDKGKYKAYINCSWGDYIIYHNKSLTTYRHAINTMYLLPLRCKIVASEQNNAT